MERSHDVGGGGAGLTERVHLLNCGEIQSSVTPRVKSILDCIIIKWA